VAKLLEASANAKVVSATHGTPFEMAEKLGLVKLAQLLSKYFLCFFFLSLLFFADCW
jgi:hypothetical protein